MSPGSNRAATGGLLQVPLGRYLPAALVERLAECDPAARDESLASHVAYLGPLLRAVATYVPEHIVAEQFARPAPGRVQGSYLDGTTLFADVSGFTAMSERLSTLGKVGAEEVTRIVNDLFTSLLGVIASYGGWLFKFGGDALTVFFAGEEHALRAGAAALAMQQEMGRFTAIETLQGTFGLRMSIGVHSGPVFAAEVGLPDRIEMIVTGDNINETARTESAADSGQVFITESTYRQMEGRAVVQPQESGFFELREAREPATGIATIEPAIPDLPPTAESLVWLVQRIEALRPYLVAGLFDKIALDPASPQIEAELRPVTVLFANFADFSQILRALGPERASEATDILNHYFTRMQTVLNKYGGTINKVDMYTHGDKLMCLFGAPLARENDPERAARAALEMQEAMAEFTHIATSVGSFALHQKIGINTGHVFAGNVGSPRRQEYSVMGDDVNLTARVMSVAKEDQVLISPSNYRRVRDLFELEALPPVRVKGKANPVQIYRVLQTRTEPRRDRDQDRGPIERPRLIGRDRELVLLQEALDRAMASNGQIVDLSGERGCGKSRLAEELERLALAPGTNAVSPRFLHGECQSFGRDIAFLPFAGLLRELFEVSSTISQDEAIGRVIDRIRLLVPELEVLAPLLGSLLGLPIPTNSLTEALSGELRRQRTFELVQGILRAEARRQPVALVLNELQWADSSSLDLLDFLVDGVEDARILLLLIHQPEFSGHWAGRPNYLEVVLKELSDREIVAVARSMLGGAELREDFERLVVQKSQGNPFYVEEVVKSLVEQGVLSRVEGAWSVVGDLTAVEIPDTIQGVLMARIDSLEERVRHLLQVASVIGRRFTRRLIEEVYPLRASLADGLADLVQLDLVQLEGDGSDPTFAFRQPMIQEVAYESMLFSRRRKYHREVGDRIETVYRDRLLEYFELLAFHFDKGEHWPKALEYGVLAGDKARGQYANPEALRYYRRVLDVLDAPERFHWRAEEMPDGGARQVVWRRSAFMGLGDVLTVLAEFDQALEGFQSALALAEEGPLRAAILARTADVYEKKSQYEQSLEQFAASLRELGDARHSVEAARLLCREGWPYFRLGKYDLAQDVATQCVQALEGTQHYRELAESYNILASVYYAQGQYDKAVEQWRRTLGIWEELGDRRGAARLRNNISIGLFRKGDQEGALQSFQEAAETFRQIGDVKNAATILNNVGIIFRSRGESETAIKYYFDSLTMHERIGDRRMMVSNHLNLGEVYRDLGQTDEALYHLQRSLAICTEIQAAEDLPEIHYQLAGTLFERGDLASALDNASEAVRLAKSYGRRLEEGLGYRVLAKVQAAQARWEEADAAFVSSADVLAEVGNELELALTRFEHASLLIGHRANLDRARGLLLQAQEVLDRIGTPRQREQVQEALAAIGG